MTQINMNVREQTAKKICQKLLGAKTILIVSHQNPDGDTLGSASAMASFLKQTGKQFDFFCATQVPKQYNFLPHIHAKKDRMHVCKEKYCVILFLDCGSIDYAGIEKEIIGMQYDPAIINIDHHASNSRYGDLHLVLPAVSSTTEILYDFFNCNQIKITDEMATALLTGIITDTDMFSNSGTTKSSIAIAGELMKKRAEIKLIKEYLIFDKPINTLKLLGIILGRLQIHARSNIAYTYLTQADLTNYVVAEEELDSIANLLNFLSEGIAAMVLKERKDGTIKASLRTNHDTFNVAEIAKKFNGGGHNKAAGFSIKETSIEKAFETIFSILEQNTK